MSASFIDRVARFAGERVAPEAAQWSMGADLDPAFYQSAAALGIFGMEVPVANGGLSLGFRDRVRACEVLAAADFGFAMSLVNTHNIAFRLATEAVKAQREQFLPALLRGEMSACTALTEPGTGSDFAAIKTTARQTQTGWVLNGEKAWIINGRHAGLSIVYAQCGAIGDSSGIAAFLVDLTAEGVTRYPIDTAFSQMSIGTGGFVLKDVSASADAMLGAQGTAFKAILTEINAARAYVAAMCNGMMACAVDTVRSYGERRMSFGKPLSTIPSWQASLAAAESALHSSQQITDGAVGLISRKADAQLAAAEAKIAAVSCAQRWLPELLQLMGAEGLRAEHPFSRHIAAAQIAGFTDGATNILRDRVAKLTSKSES